MLLTFMLTLSLSSPILEENAVSVRNDTCKSNLFSTARCTATPSQPLLNKKIRFDKSKSFSNFTFKTIF